MCIRFRKCARKYSERFDHGNKFLIGKIDPCFILQPPPEHRYQIRQSRALRFSQNGTPRGKLRVLEVLCGIPFIGVLESKTDFVWATSECE